MRKWLFGPGKVREPRYDDTMHELHATTVELQKNVDELNQVAQSYLDASNPLIALTITLLNQQQMGLNADDDKSHS